MSAVLAGLSGDAVRFIVHGHPVTQAGMRTVPTGAGPRQITTGGVGLAGWRQEVAAAAAHAANETHTSFVGKQAVEVSIEFRFPMLKSTPKRDRVIGTAFRLGRVDDIDKLIRAVLDGLTSSGLIGDDGNVVDLHASKRMHAAGWLGADITVRPALLFPGLDPIVEQR